MYTTKRYKHILPAIGIVLLLAGISACSSSGKSGLQTVQSSTAGNQETEPDSSAAPEAIPKTAAPQGAAADRGEGFDTPEAAVNAYLDGLRSGELKGMMDTFAVGNYIDNYITALKSNGILGTGGMTNIMTGIVETPSAKKFYRRIAVENREGAIADDILSQYAVICRLGLDAGPIRLEEDGKGKEFVDQLSKQMEGTDFSSLTLLGFLPPEELYDTYVSDGYLKGQTMRAQNYGADQFADLAAVIDVAGKKSILIFEAAKYDGSWYNLKLGGILSELMTVDQAAAGAIALDADDGKRLEREMKEKGFLSASSARPSIPAAAAEVIESEGFDSPEMAAAAYLEGLKAGDLDRMLGAFAVESYVEHYNLPAYLEQSKIYSFLNQEFNLPVVNGFSRDINIQSRKKTVIDQISGQFSAVCILNGSYYGGRPMPEEKLGSNDYTQELAKMIDAVDTGSLKILGYIPPETISKSYSTDSSQEFRASWTGISGAGRQESCAVVFEIGGNKYVICPDVTEYNGKWYIKTLNGQLSALLSISADLMGTMPLDAGNMPELEASIVPFK